METQLLSLQPELSGPTLRLRPLVAADVEPLYAAAGDPLIWAQHPSPTRYQRPVFDTWFAQALASRGCLVVIDRASERLVGSSRYYALDEAARSVAIGFTFLTREFWGGAANAEMKRLMLAHAFQWASTVWFHVGPDNVRSQKAMAKIGGRYSHRGPLDLGSGPVDYVFYRIDAADFAASPLAV